MNNCEIRCVNKKSIDDAVLIAHNAMLDQYTIQFRPRTMKDSDLLFRQIIMDARNLNDFAQSQSLSNEYLFTAGNSFLCKTNYMCSAKECNDLRIIASEIGVLLRKKIKDAKSIYDVLRIYQSWINNYFKYQQTGEIEDHSAVSLLKNRTGVCQAIAAISLLILPYLGLQTQFVSGYCDGTPHAWNVIKVNDRWIHVDFTFGMAMYITPSTINDFYTYLFKKHHTWEKDEYTNSLLNSNVLRQKQLLSKRIKLFSNIAAIQIGDTLIFTKHMMKGEYIHIMDLLNCLGGACEYVHDKNVLNICLSNKRYEIPNASAFLSKEYPDYVQISVLGLLWNYHITHTGLELTLHE